MMYLCMVIDVIQKKNPDKIMVMIPGTHPRTLFPVSDHRQFQLTYGSHERDQDCAMIAKHTCSPASRQAVFCQDMVRSLMSCWWSDDAISAVL